LSKPKRFFTPSKAL